MRFNRQNLLADCKPDSPGLGSAPSPYSPLTISMQAGLKVTATRVAKVQLLSEEIGWAELNT